MQKYMYVHVKMIHQCSATINLIIIMFDAFGMNIVAEFRKKKTFISRMNKTAVLGSTA